jgi:predicted ATPase
MMFDIDRSFAEYAEQPRILNLTQPAVTRGEPLEDPLLLFAVLYSFWVANSVGFNGDVSLNLATQYLALAEKQNATIPRMIGHRLKGFSLVYTGDITEGRTHLDQSFALFDPVQHRPMAAQLGHDAKVAVLTVRSLALWTLGLPDAALADVEEAIKDAHEIGQAQMLMFMLANTAFTSVLCGRYDAANANCDELIALAEKKGAPMWKASGCLTKGWLVAVSGEASDAVKALTSAIDQLTATRSTVLKPWYLAQLAKTHAELGQFKEAWRCITEATTTIEVTKERWNEAELNRVAGEIALKSPERDTAKAEMYFERAIEIARQQQAKSWELRAAMSLARLWRSQGKVQQARELLAPVYGWFTEGFDTRDLKEAKALLEELGS